MECYIMSLYNIPYIYIYMVIIVVIYINIWLFPAFPLEGSHSKFGAERARQKKERKAQMWQDSLPWGSIGWQAELVLFLHCEP